MSKTSLTAFATAATLAAGSADAALVLHYTFDDADIVGTVAQDDQVGLNDSSEAVAGTVTPGATGVFGQAYSVSGAGYITAPSGVVPSGNSARTISIWFNAASAAAAQNKIFGYGTNTASQAFDIGPEADGLRIRHFGGNILYGSGLDFVGDDAGWHHLAVRVNAGATDFNDVDVFLDGALLTGVTTGGDGLNEPINTADSVFGIGASSIPGVQFGFDGLLDELRVYDNALTNQEIADLAVVPEPGSLALLGLGGLLVARRRRGA